MNDSQKLNALVIISLGLIVTLVYFAFRFLN